MKKLLNILKAPLTFAAKAEISVLHFSRGLMFTMIGITSTIVNNMLGDKTGEKENVLDKASKKIWNGMERFEIAQLKTFGRLKIFDSATIAKKTYDYFRSNFFNFKLTQRLDTLLDWNKKGILNDKDTASILRDMAKAEPLGLEDRRFNLPQKEIDQAWNKITDWIGKKGPALIAQESGNAGLLLSTLSEAKIPAQETPEGLAIGNLSSRRKRLLIIFNNEVQAAGDKPLVVYSPEYMEEVKTGSISKAIADFERAEVPQHFNSYARTEIAKNIKDTAEFLKDYQRRHPQPA